MSVKVLKKSEASAIASKEPISAFQLSQAKVKSQNAMKQLEFYGESVDDPDFQNTFRERLKELCTKFQLAV